jgi:hypothetical protein
VAALPLAGEYFPHETLENIRGDWLGWVFPVAGRVVLGAETIGGHAAWFEAVLTPDGPVRIEQAFVFDRELFAPGPDPLLEVGVRLRFAEGWVELGVHQVTLRGRDDTPPEALRFAWGGQVLETDVAGIIGGLAVTDIDTPQGGHSFRLAWPDEAWFEVVDGNVLKLRQGVDLLRSGGTMREVIVLASDGVHEVAMTIAFEVVNVTDLDDIPANAAPLAPPEPPMVAISAVFWGRGELRPAVLSGPVAPAAAAGPANAAEGHASAWLAAVTRAGLVVLDTDRDGRYTVRDHMLDAGRNAWTTPPDELRREGSGKVQTPSGDTFALLLLDRGGGDVPPEQGEAGHASSDWFA